jgi:diacylglycerol kinase (ATP)
VTDAVVIVNPRAGRGSAMDVVRRELTNAAFEAEVVATERPGHGTDLARKARADGIPLVIAAGGDGTVHEVVNGLLAEGAAGAVPQLGVLPLGSGCDYAKTFEISPDHPAAALGRIITSPGRSVDAAGITYREGATAVTRYFANIAEVGIGGSCVARAARLPRFLGPAMYGVAFLLILPRFKQLDAKITLDEQTYEGPLTDLVVAIGQVFGGGMRVAPKADPADGMFDVQVHFGTKVDYVRALPKVYKGTHIPHRRIREERARTVTIECDPAGLIEADGEVLGHTPATFRVLPAALQLRA